MTEHRQAKAASGATTQLWRAVTRFGIIVVLAYSVGAGLNRVGSMMGGSDGPAGFPRGLVQGALMPMALPNLLFGRDVIIYSAQNTGVGYKLGYTTGVNACGALFFGFFFWRVNRWRHRVGKRELGSGPVDPG